MDDDKRLLVLTGKLGENVFRNPILREIAKKAPTPSAVERGMKKQGYPNDVIAKVKAAVKIRINFPDTFNIFLKTETVHEGALFQRLLIGFDEENPLAHNSTAIKLDDAEISQDNLPILFREFSLKHCNTFMFDHSIHGKEKIEDDVILHTVPLKTFKEMPDTIVHPFWKKNTPKAPEQYDFGINGHDGWLISQYSGDIPYYVLGHDCFSVRSCSFMVFDHGFDIPEFYKIIEIEMDSKGLKEVITIIVPVINFGKKGRDSYGKLFYRASMKNDQIKVIGKIDFLINSDLELLPDLNGKLISTECTQTGFVIEKSWREHDNTQFLLDANQFLYRWVLDLGANFNKHFIPESLDSILNNPLRSENAPKSLSKLLTIKKQ